MLVWIGYVALINIFLSTSLFDRIVNSDPITLDIHYARGWSLWPGTIHARHLSIRSSDSNVEWILKLDEVTFDVSFLALPQRRFEVERARGTGISMRVRQKLDVGPQEIADISSLPPIPGFPAYSMAPAGPHHPELWDDNVYHLITVRLEDVVADDVREIWVNDVRFSGHAKIAGRFYLKPLRAVDIGPAHVEIQSGELDKGLSQMIATQLGGHFDFTADRFDPRKVHDNEFLRYATIATDLHATSNDLAKMPFAAPVYLAGVIDAPKIGLQMNHGVLAQGTELVFSTPKLLAAKNDIIGSSKIDVHAVIDGENRLHAELRLADTAVVRPDNAEYLRADSLVVEADSAKLDLVDGPPFPDVHFATQVTNARVPNARLGNCILPCTMRIHSGSATVNGRIEVWPYEKRAVGSTELRYDDVDVTIPDLAARGSGDVALSFGSFTWGDDGHVEDVRVRGQLTNTQLVAKDVHAGLGAGDVTFDAPRVALADPLKSASFDADIRARGASFAAASVTANGMTAHAQVTKANNTISGQIAGVTPDIAFAKGKLDTHGRAEFAIDLQSLSGNRLSLGQSHITLTHAKGTVAGKPLFVAQRIRVDGRTHDFDLKSPSLAPISGQIVIADTAIADATALQALISPKSKVRITSGSAVASGQVAIANGDLTGHIAVEAKRAGFALAESTLVGDATLTANINTVDAETIDLSGSHLALRNIDVTHAAAETRGWHGDIAFDATHLSWADGTPSLGSTIDLTARDAKPILGMLLRDQAPKVLAKLATMPNLELHGRLDADPNAIVLSDFDAHGGDVAFRGSYAVRDGDKAGALVVSKGGVAMGLRLGNDGAHPKFFGLDSWLTTEEKKVKTAPSGGKAAEKP